MTIKVRHEETCNLKSDNDTVVEAEVLEFRPQTFLTVTVNRKVKVTLQYNSRHDLYVGNMAGLELTTPGPKELITYEGRRRR